MRKIWLAALLTLAVACGETPSDTTASAPSAPPTHTPAPPPASTTPGAPGPASAPAPAPSLVTPAGHTVRTRKVRWLDATPSADGRSLEIVWWSGVEPCNVLDRVEVAETPKTVTVTLYEGTDPRSPDVACIDIALKKRTAVALKAPLDGRKVVDGAAG
ncbi:hypothetical protein JOL79_26235 [Microbispora sp. RL4-1S]|uniref:Uncharacterized protein n=1 Tax=Microbispora oryzae TaxID=2806554 RepID=A0A940WPQ1_9ACTN|nr:hypothetical protein [Microbispora oryzae]MBP2707287.1 hypothetical protein [Microbispora oryzae]